MSRAINITGQKFGRLVAIKPCGKTSAGNVLWLCKCDCGKETTVPTQHLKSGNTQSCGCLNSELASKRFTKTGESNHRLYRIWRNMKRRCYDDTFKAYKNYGAKGVLICEEWLNSFDKFKEWALANGYDYDAPRGQCTLDRIDNDGNYEPSNCRWATLKEQLNNNSRNVLITANGETHNLQQWADILGTTHATLHSRYRYGWSDERIINTPIKKYRKGV